MKQKICLWLGMAAIAIMLLYPPRVDVKGNRFYAIMFSYGEIDIKILSMQFGVVALTTAGFVVSLKGNKAGVVNDTKGHTE